MNPSLTQNLDVFDLCTERRIRNEICDGVAVSFDGDSSQEGGRSSLRSSTGASSLFYPRDRSTASALAVQIRRPTL